MPTYRINGRHVNEREIEADMFEEQGTFVVFSDEEGDQVFAMPTRTVMTIERLEGYGQSDGVEE